MRTEPKIRTQMDPRQFRAEHQTVRCRNASGEFTATVEIIHEGYDQQTTLFTLVVGIHYPRTPKGGGVSLTVEGGVARKEPDYFLTQRDFDDVISGGIISVP